MNKKQLQSKFRPGKQTQAYWASKILFPVHRNQVHMTRSAVPAFLTFMHVVGASRLIQSLYFSLATFRCHY